MLAGLALLPGACRERGGGTPELSGAIVIDGSSSLFPLVQAAAEDFHRSHPQVRFSVGGSGTGAGFDRFLSGTTDVAGASRPIAIREVRDAERRGLEFCELPVALDGIAVVVGRGNEFVDQLTLTELRRVFARDTAAATWAEVRPGWPARPVRVYGPGPDSGSHDDFSRRVIGPGARLRDDLRASEDDQQLVVGIAGDPSAIGFFGRSYLIGNQGRVRAVPIDDGQGPVAPDVAAIVAGDYAPLVRPLFVYISLGASARRPALRAFVDHLLDNAEALAGEVGYVPLEPELLQRARDNFAARRTGTQFQGPRDVRRPLAEVYR